VGIRELKAEILTRTIGDRQEEADPLVVTSERQRLLLERAGKALRRAMGGLVENAPSEIVALEVRSAAEELGAILGEHVYEGVLDDLFSRFCIGK
jgi:tRNA modification GTPase